MDNNFSSMMAELAQHEAKMAVVDKTCDQAWGGILDLIREHTKNMKIETVGGYLRPFEIERDPSCFQCYFGQEHPLWNDIWKYLEQYGLNVEYFRERLFATMRAGCDSGQVVDQYRFKQLLREALRDVIRHSDPSEGLATEGQ